MAETKHILRKELCELTNRHNIVACHDEESLICQRVQQIGQVLASGTKKFKMTNRDGRIMYVSTLNEIREVTRSGMIKIKSALDSGGELKCWVIERTKL